MIATILLVGLMCYIAGFISCSALLYWFLTSKLRPHIQAVRRWAADAKKLMERLASTANVDPVSTEEDVVGILRKNGQERRF